MGDNMDNVDNIVLKIFISEKNLTLDNYKVIEC